MYFCLLFFFFNDTATTEIYTLSLHDALPIFSHSSFDLNFWPAWHWGSAAPRSIQKSLSSAHLKEIFGLRDRKSTRLNSSHANISYAVFCLQKQILHYIWDATSCIACTQTSHL